MSTGCECSQEPLRCQSDGTCSSSACLRCPTCEPCGYSSKGQADSTPSVDSRLQDTERSKVLQSISSVIQALPPEDEIGPVEVCGSSLPTERATCVDVSKTIVNPIVTRLFEALQMSSRVSFGDRPCTQTNDSSAPGGCQTPRDSTAPGFDWSCQGPNTRV